MLKQSVSWINCQEHLLGQILNSMFFLVLIKFIMTRKTEKISNDPYLRNRKIKNMNVLDDLISYKDNEI